MVSPGRTGGGRVAVLGSVTLCHFIGPGAERLSPSQPVPGPGVTGASGPQPGL